jgi:hypothetical protein
MRKWIVQVITWICRNQEVMFKLVKFTNAAWEQRVVTGWHSHRGPNQAKWPTHRSYLPYKPQQQSRPSKVWREKVPYFASVFLFQDKECCLFSPLQVGARLVAWGPCTLIAGREFPVGRTRRLWEARTQIHGPSSHGAIPRPLTWALEPGNRPQTPGAPYPPMQDS